MINSTDFRTGLTIEYDGGIWQIVDFQHVKPGKGAAFVRTKIKNVELSSAHSTLMKRCRQHTLRRIRCSTSMSRMASIRL